MIVVSAHYLPKAAMVDWSRTASGS